MRSSSTKYSGRTAVSASEEMSVKKLVRPRTTTLRLTAPRYRRPAAATGPGNVGHHLIWQRRIGPMTGRAGTTSYSGRAAQVLRHRLAEKCFAQRVPEPQPLPAGLFQHLELLRQERAREENAWSSARRTRSRGAGPSSGPRRISAPRVSKNAARATRRFAASSCEGVPWCVPMQRWKCQWPRSTVR